jgi:glycosyltransferase involved in cell wall biosynthesis
MIELQSISVIMPTLANEDRASGLVRAIDSVLGQEGVRVVPIIIANGTKCSPDVLEDLGRRRDIRLVRLEEASLPLALKAGRNTVDTPYFAELDDDDELLPHALITRLDKMGDDGTVDVVVTNGLLQGFGSEVISTPNITDFQADPLRAILRDNWLAPGSALFRTETVTCDFFEAIPKYLEWTYLGVILSLRRKILFVNHPTYVYRTDNKVSISKSRECALMRPQAIERLLKLDVPRDVRALIKGKLAAARHRASSCELAAGNYAAAWFWHMRSLMLGQGWKYLTYTRHLMVRKR